MRILIVTQWFQPEPHYKGLNFARALRDRGHDVEVLTGFPNYPGGKVYEGYKLSVFRREMMDGIKVNRCWLYPSHDQSALRRILNYVSFALTSAIASLFIKRPDVVYVYTPPMTAALAGLALRIFRGVPYVIDVQDLWPDTLAATGMVRSSKLVALVGWFTNFVFRHAARMIVLSDGFRRQIKARSIPTPIAVVRNWAPPEIVSISQMQRAPEVSDLRLRPFNILFAGNIGLAQGLDVIIEAAQLLKNQGASVSFEIIGGGLEWQRLMKRASTEVPEMVNVHPYRHPSDMAQVFSGADALLVHLRRDPLFEITIPSKTQAYMAIGKPILMGVRGDAADLVKDACAGLLFLPECPKSLADAVVRMMTLSPTERKRMGDSGAQYYTANLAFDVGVASIEEELRQAARQ